VVFNRDFNEPRKSADCRSDLSEFHIDATDTEKVCDGKFDVSAESEKGVTVSRLLTTS